MEGSSSSTCAHCAVLSSFRRWLKVTLVVREKLRHRAGAIALVLVQRLDSIWSGGSERPIQRPAPPPLKIRFLHYPVS